MSDQGGVVARSQLLAAGWSPHDIRRRVRRRELARVHPGVYVDHTGVPSWHQRAWAAVLSVWPAALSHDSALRAAEGPGSPRPDHGPVHVAVDRDRHVAAPDGVVVHRVSGLAERVQWHLGPPRVRYEEAALDVAAEAPTDLAALGTVAAACQSRRTTAARMHGRLVRRSRLRRRSWMLGVLRDVAEGACSVLEHGYLHRVERAHGLPRASRQVRAEGTCGVTYRDAAYDDLVVELDGRLFHDTTHQRDRDMDRDLDAAVDDQLTVRLSYGQVFDRGCRTAARIAMLLQRRGWQGEPVRCGPGCPVVATVRSIRATR